MNIEKEYAFVLDAEGKKLSPTPTEKAWYLIRKKRATLVEKFPMVIQLTKVIPEGSVDKSEITLGIDDGSKHVGIGLIQHTKTGKAKPVLKGTIENSNNVKKRMDTRRFKRRYRRNHKKYRPARFNNRAGSTRKGRIAPSIKQKKESILRVVKQLNKWTRINTIVLEDVLIDVRALTEGKRLYGKEYTISDKLDNSMRTAVLMRDNFTCQMTGKTNISLEVHHIIPRRFGGADSLKNLITLSKDAHKSIEGKELDYKELFFSITKGEQVDFSHAQHVMQGKTYLREELEKITSLSLTYGTETHEKRKEYDIPKSHSNDALVIAGISHNHLELKDWVIRPLRKKSEAKNLSQNGLKHRDFVSFESKRSATKFSGWITAIRDNGKTCSVTDVNGKTYRRYSLNSMKLIWRFNNIQWI